MDSEFIREIDKGYTSEGLSYKVVNFLKILTEGGAP